jgi:tetratricopeptide (TPR) repeat protein
VEVLPSWTVWRDRAKASIDAKQWHEAVAHFSKAIDLKPDDAYCRHFRGLAHSELDQWDKALEDYAAAAELKPTDLWYCDQHGFACAQLGQWEKAAAVFEHLTTLRAPYARAWYFLALLQLQRGDRAGYRKVCSRMLERLGETTDLGHAYWTTWACVLAPDAVTDWTKPLNLAEKVHAANPTSYDRTNNLGAVLYRAGRFKEAVHRFTEAEAVFKPNRGAWTTIVYNSLFQAMAQHQLGHTAEAARRLEKAVQAIDGPPPETGQEDWNRRLTLQLLRREAEELLAKKSQ